MQVDFTGRQIDVTEDLRRFTHAHLRKLNRFLSGGAQLHVILTAEKHRRLAEVTLTLKTQTFVGLNESRDAHTSIKGALDKLERQVVRWRQKRWTKKHRSKPTTAVVLNVVAAGRARSKPSNGGVISERIPLEVLTVDEAVKSLHSARDGVVVFRNMNTARVNVVYRRPDSKVGLIEPVS
jgi:ribosome hibernation promoting factor